MRVEKIGLATLYLGDCREIAAGLERPAAVISDPPYGIGRDGSKRTTSRHGGRKAYDFLGWDVDRPAPDWLLSLSCMADAVVLWGGAVLCRLLATFPALAGLEQRAAHHAI